VESPGKAGKIKKNWGTEWRGAPSVWQMNSNAGQKLIRQRKWLKIKRHYAYAM